MFCNFNIIFDTCTLEPHVILFHTWMQIYGENMVLDIDKIEFIMWALLLNETFCKLVKIIN